MDSVGCVSVHKLCLVYDLSSVYLCTSRLGLRLRSPLPPPCTLPCPCSRTHPIWGPRSSPSLAPDPDRGRRSIRMLTSQSRSEKRRRNSRQIGRTPWRNLGRWARPIHGRRVGPTVATGGAVGCSKLCIYTGCSSIL